MTEYRLRELKLELNRSCPLYCLHCSSNGMPRAPEHLEPKKLSELIKEFAYMGGERLCLSGGEPLYYKELPAVINACRRQNLAVSLYTTGIARNGGALKPISEKTADFLADSNIQVVFSLHGARANTHDKLTQAEGSFDSTIRAIERVTNAGALTEAHVVPMALNFPELASITELAGSLGIRKISWLRFVPQGRGWFNKSILQLSREQLRELASIKTELRTACPEVSIRTGAPYNILCPQVPATCEAGISMLTINPDGSVSPCDAFKRFRVHDDFGNILQHPLTEVWHKSFILNAVRNLHEFKLNSPCASCSLYSRCNSGCLAQKAIAAGTIANGKDPDCPLDGVEVTGDEVEAISVR